MSSHSRGPWRTENMEGRLHQMIASADDEAIAEAYWYGLNEPDDAGRGTRQKANAILISAAPDLLGAAKGALARYPELNTLRAAIDKAEGNE